MMRMYVLCLRSRNRCVGGCEFYTKKFILGFLIIELEQPFVNNLEILLVIVLVGHHLLITLKALQQ